MKSIVFTVLMSVSFIASCGTGTGKITGYIPYVIGSEEILYIKVENHSDSPQCNTSVRFTMKSSSPFYKSTQPAVLAAFMAGTQVTVRGNGTCNNTNNAEDMVYMCLGSIPC